MKEDVTQIINAIEGGDSHAAEQLLPLVYGELRRLAAQKMANERAGHTLQPTALVHEAYLRLLAPGEEPLMWDSRRHFFCAAAEAMRRILIESARSKKSLKRGKDARQVDLTESLLVFTAPSEEILAIDEALKKLEVENPEFAQVVKLRYFAGLTIPETAAFLEVSESTVTRTWRSARAWLYNEVSDEDRAS